jgi:hypothetical protein
LLQVKTSTLNIIGGKQNINSIKVFLCFGEPIIRQP